MNELLNHFHFLRPGWLVMLLPALIMTLLLARRGDGEGNWSRAIAPELLKHLLDGEQQRRSRRSLYAVALAWCLASFAAAGPSWQQLPRPVLQKQDALVVLMDLSYSMLATDLQPSRADRVRRKIQDLLRQRREGLSALVAYAGDAHVVAPLTDDNRTIGNLLPALDPAMMPLPGSNAPQALEQALSLLSSSGIRSGRLLLVTDGIDSVDRERIVELLAESPHRLAILGVGTDVGAPIPLPGGGFLKDDSGEIVVPPLPESELRELATRTGGAYRRLRVDDEDLSALLQATASVFDDERINRQREADEWQDMGHWFVLPLLALCLLAFRRGQLYGLALLLWLPAADSRADLWDDLWLTRDQQAAQALAEGDAESAASLFEDPRWRGAAAWEAGDYEAAQEAFARGSDGDAWYNRGNALAAAGRLEEAIEAYRRSLELTPGAEDARANIETLEELLRQQQEQQQQQDQQQQNQDGQQQPQDSGQQDPSDQGDPQQQDPGQSSEGGSREPQSQQPQSGEQEQEGQENAEDSQDPQQSQPREAPSQGEDGQPLSPEIDNSAMQESLERDQALQQWLRRVPDDPSGLLREKFRYESRRRQQQGETRNSDKIW